MVLQLQIYILFFAWNVQQVLSASSKPALSLEEAEWVLKVKPAGGEDWEIQFDKKKGLLSSWKASIIQAYFNFRYVGKNEGHLPVS